MEDFTYMFVRNYDIIVSRRRRLVIALGDITNNIVVDVLRTSACYQDQTAIDRLEEIALIVPAPGPTLTPSSSEVSERTLIWK